MDFDTHSKSMKYAYSLIKKTLDETTLDYLKTTRAYFHEEQLNTLRELNVYQSVKPLDINEREKQLLTELGFYTSKGYFLLENRFIIPVYSASKELITLIGWYNDYKKYITIPTPFFSKKVDWFNLDHALRVSYETYDGLVFVVEGVFDALSLRSLGLPVVATMGSDVTKSKAELLKIFNKVVGIPDNDKRGRKSLQQGRWKWELPYNSKLVDIRGSVDFGEGNVFPVKDIDNLVSWYPPEPVKELLLKVAQSPRSYEIIKL